MAERQDKRPPPTKRGLRILSTCLPAEEAEGFLSKYPPDLTVSEILRALIRAADKAKVIVQQSPAPIKIDSIVISQGRDGSGIPASVAVLKEAVARAKVILSKGGKMTIQLREEINKDLQDCKKARATLPEDLAKEVGDLLDLGKVIMGGVG